MNKHHTIAAVAAIAMMIAGSAYAQAEQTNSRYSDGSRLEYSDTDVTITTKDKLPCANNQDCDVVATFDRSGPFHYRATAHGNTVVLHRPADFNKRARSARYVQAEIQNGYHTAVAVEYDVSE